LHPHPRNLDDEMIRALAKTGGVVCVIFYPAFLEPGWSAKKDQVDNEIAPLVKKASEEEKGDVAHKKLARDRVRREEYLKRLPPVSVSRIVDHIDHIVKLVGIEHVGIGSDFDGIQATVHDLSSVAELPNLTRELLRRMTINGGVQHCIGKEVSRFEQGKDDFIENIDDVCIHYDGGHVVANESLIAEISKRGLRKTTKETGLDRKTIRVILKGKKVKASTLAKVVIALQREDLS